MGLPEEHQSVQTLLFDRSNESLCMRIAIRRSVWRLHDPDADVREELAERQTPLRISIADQDAIAAEDPVVPVRQSASDLQDERVVRMRRRADEMDAPGL